MSAILIFVQTKKTFVWFPPREISFYSESVKPHHQSIAYNTYRWAHHIPLIGGEGEGAAPRPPSGLGNISEIFGILPHDDPTKTKNTYLFHGRPENFKKSMPKKFVKSNKSISRNFLDQIPFFAISTMAKNKFLNCEKV